MTPAPSRIVGGDGTVPIRVDLRTGDYVADEFIVDLGRFVPELDAWAVATNRHAVSRATEWVVARSWRGSTLVRIPAGFRHDGASMPVSALIRLIAGKRERYAAAAAVHDLLYFLGAPRRASDLAFRIVAESGEANVGAFRGAATYWALRLFGWRAHRGHARRRAGKP